MLKDTERKSKKVSMDTYSPKEHFWHRPSFIKRVPALLGRPPADSVLKSHATDVRTGGTPRKLRLKQRHSIQVSEPLEPCVRGSPEETQEFAERHSFTVQPTCAGFPRSCPVTGSSYNLCQSDKWQ